MALFEVHDSNGRAGKLHKKLSVAKGSLKRKDKGLIYALTAKGKELVCVKGMAKGMMDGAKACGIEVLN